MALTSIWYDNTPLSSSSVISKRWINVGIPVYNNYGRIVVVVEEDEKALVTTVANRIVYLFSACMTSILNDPSNPIYGFRANASHSAHCPSSYQLVARAMENKGTPIII